jgi:hypothetical protein
MLFVAVKVQDRGYRRFVEISLGHDAHDPILPIDYREMAHATHRHKIFGYVQFVAPV